MSRVPTRVKVVIGIATYLASSLVWGPMAEAALNDGNDHLLVAERLAREPALVDIIGLRTQPAPAYKPLRASGTASGPSVRITESSGRCGGDLPSCSIMECESGGSLTARNPSGAAGKWQMMPGTWNGYGGYSSADQAPESVQDAKARELWAGGAGRGHWRQCL